MRPPRRHPRAPARDVDVGELQRASTRVDFDRAAPVECEDVTVRPTGTDFEPSEEEEDAGGVWEGFEGGASVAVASPPAPAVEVEEAVGVEGEAGLETRQGLQVRTRPRELDEAECTFRSSVLQAHCHNITVISDNAKGLLDALAAVREEGERSIDAMKVGFHSRVDRLVAIVKEWVASETEKVVEGYHGEATPLHGPENSPSQNLRSLPFEPTVA